MFSAHMLFFLLFKPLLDYICILHLSVWELLCYLKSSPSLCIVCWYSADLLFHPFHPLHPFESNCKPPLQLHPFGVVLLHTELLAVLQHV